jgi:hypothetical protein
MKIFKALSETEMRAVRGGSTIMGSGTDEGGYFVIIDNGTQCVKVYRNNNGPGHPAFDH